MIDFSLVPVGHQPDFSDVSLVPVDHNPFSADDMIQQVPTQLESQPRRSAASDVPIPGDVNAAMPEADQNPNLGLGAVLMRAATGLVTLPQRAIDASAEDVLHLGEDGYTPQSIGPAAETALTMMGGSGTMPAGANELRAGLKLPMGTASRLARAKEMGFRTDMPLYHGSGTEFSSARAVPTNAAGMEPPEVSLALDPKVANEFAAARGSGKKREVSASAIGDGLGGSYDSGGYVPGGGLYSPGAGGYVGTETALQDATFLIPDSGPTRPLYEQVSTGTEASQGFARVFEISVGAGTPTIGDASFGAAAQSSMGIIAAGPDSITSAIGITAYDGNTMMYFEPTNGNASVTVSVDPATRNVTVVQNPGRPA